MTTEITNQLRYGMGNTVARAMVARVDTPLEKMMQAMQAMGLSADQAAATLTRFGEQVGSPKQELLFRLNERLQGRDPGKPVHWRGLAA